MNSQWIECQEKIRELKIKLQGWPGIGDKITFRGSEAPFWFNEVNAAQSLLQVDKEYEISNIQVNSSSCFVWLKGFEETFSLHYFDYEKKVVDKKALEKEIYQLMGKLRELSNED